MRLALRRHYVRRIKRHCGDVWPIDESAATAPKSWPGWPDGKKFAFVLSHDIEGQLGLGRTRQLAELEMELGLRSSFNFIPEGEYSVPSALRSWLVEQGFEVGLHDLHHDGKLYSNKNSFHSKAQRINHYLNEWNAVGFRSGFMLHNLDWLHQLNILYDASTFDTDPFEPQPDAANAIFPFWVPREGEVGSRTSEVRDQRSDFNFLNHQLSTINQPQPSTLNHPRGGYVELPYTLAQDSTLFLLLREKTIATWKRKLDWIAEHGGMALVNIHPDYVRFGATKISAHTYPIHLIIDLLAYVREKYGDSVWHALPREVAEFTAFHRPRLAHQPKRICMLTYSHYEADARVRRYAESLAERGDHVDVVALKRSPNDPAQAKVGLVNLYNLQQRVGKTERSRIAFLFPVLRFLSLSTIWITIRHARRPYNLVHIHNMPDFLVFAASYPKLTGAKVILDIHDIVPEFYGSKFGGGNGSRTVSLLKYIERVCARKADQVIISNHLWLAKYANRTASNGKCSVFINNVDTQIFAPRQRTRNDGKLVILFPGGLQWHQGLDIALRAFKRVSQVLPNAEFHIYGDGIVKPSLVTLATELGFDGNVRFFPPVRVTEIAEIMANADLGVVPKRADSFGNEAYSTKIMEFMSQGVPTVISRTAIDSYYFNEDQVRFCESGNAEAFAEGMIEVLTDANLREGLVRNAHEYVSRNNWGCMKHAYLDLVDRLIADANAPATR
jgi:glycosyltransferase involved in cell wall biosynthesis